MYAASTPPALAAHAAAPRGALQVRAAIALDYNAETPMTYNETGKLLRRKVKAELQYHAAAEERAMRRARYRRWSGAHACTRHDEHTCYANVT